MVRNRDLEELMPRAGTFADNTKDLVAKLKVLTVAEQQQEDARLEAKAELERGNAAAAAKAEAELQKQEEARVAAAMKEVRKRWTVVCLFYILRMFCFFFLVFVCFFNGGRGSSSP